MAQQSQTLLKNYYLKGLHSYKRGLEEAPYGFLIPDGQGDPERVAQMVARLLSLGIEVQRAASDITLKEGTFPAGTYVVRLDQPYRDYAVDLLTPQQYPKDRFAEAYDDVSWELPAHSYHVAVVATADRRCARPIHGIAGGAPGSRDADGDGPVFILKDSGQEDSGGAAFALARFKVAIAERTFSVNGTDYPAGSDPRAAAGSGRERTRHRRKTGPRFRERSRDPRGGEARDALYRGSALWCCRGRTLTQIGSAYARPGRRIPYVATCAG
jgi:hypothetical protein